MLVLEVDAYNAPEREIWFQMEFEGTIKVRGIEEGVERVTMTTF